MSVKMVVGLGNPGKKYERTRHNIGAQVVKFLQSPDAPLHLPENVEFFLPTDGIFMNECGPWIASRARKGGRLPEDLLVICDDFMIPYPQLRIRTKGSSGGHNGLQSILDAFGTQGIARLRIGVGPVPPEQDPADFVLQNFKQSASEIKADLILRAADAVVVYLTKGPEVAMNKYNPKVETA